MPRHPPFLFHFIRFPLFHHNLLALAGLDFKQAAVGHYTEWATEMGDDGAAGELAVFPNYVLYFETAATAQAVNTSAWPCRRQCREKTDKALMALNKHFGNTGRTAKVAVNLEGGM